MTRVPPLLGAARTGHGVVMPARSFFNLADSFSKKKEYSERRIIGWVTQVCLQLWSNILKLRLESELQSFVSSLGMS